MWENEWGDIFDSEEEAYEDCCSRMTIDDYADGMIYHLSYDDLLQWAMEQEGFWEHFEDIMANIRQEFFINYYSEIENENAD